mmetsp:Transcript_21955/g.29345  ORF Transcript_21955/g.29345 Transcript_21955/m.29345 type:complete len:102 (+) Transcript_21955:370-675(+)
MPLMDGSKSTRASVLIKTIKPLKVKLVTRVAKQREDASALTLSTAVTEPDLRPIFATTRNRCSEEEKRVLKECERVEMKTTFSRCLAQLSQKKHTEDILKT